jgi:glutamine amidotransferase
MCRFVLYMGTPIVLSSLITEPDHSIIRQSFGSLERDEPLNGDGFGMAWFVPDLTDEPAVFKDVSPAWSNDNLLNVARVTRSAVVLAHVRAATPGLAVANVNCHPFTHGPLAFMHNGVIGGFRKIVRRLRAQLSDEAYQIIKGTTDSEHLFALIWDAFEKRTTGTTVERIAAGVQEAFEQVERLKLECGVTETSQLNIAVSDGHCAVVTRYSSDPENPANSLYVHTGGSYSCVDGKLHLAETATDETRAVIVASERLSREGCWVRVPPKTLLLIDQHLNLEQVPLKLSTLVH